MGIVDTHCHLDFAAFDEDREEVIKRARDAGVDAMVLIATHPESWTSTAALSASTPGFARVAGIHPNYVAEHWSHETPSLLSKELEAPDIVAVGETGLDYFRSSETRDQQVEAFECQLDIAAATGLPVIIHQRSAEDDVLERVRRLATVSGVMHCFTGDWAFARRCLDAGLYLGIGGVATFPRSYEVRDAIARAPAGSLLLETDAPFLAPQAWRGKRNEPAYLHAVVDVIAEARGETREQVIETTTMNAVGLFGPRLGKWISTPRGTESPP